MSTLWAETPGHHLTFSAVMAVQRLYQPKCECGWVGTTWIGARLAVRQHDDHLERERADPNRDTLQEATQ